MATTRKAEAALAPEIEVDLLDRVDPWEGFTPEERERGWRILTPEEGREQFDRAARHLMGIGGDGFVRRWDAGEYDEIADKDGHRHIMHLAVLGASGGAGWSCRPTRLKRRSTRSWSASG